VFRVEQIGDCTLYLGDCADIIPSLALVHCIVTSPPYNQLEGLSTEKLSGIWALKGPEGFAKGNFVDNDYFDGMPEGEYQDWQSQLFSKIPAVEGASLFYNHQIRWRDGELLHPVQWFRPRGWKLRQEIVWDRGGGMMMNARMFCRFDERILWFTNGAHKWNQPSVGHGTVWRIAREQNKDHPVAFPIAIPERCIAAATDAGDVVLDPFMGSATTGEACIRTGRRFIGIELNQKYFDIACRRLEESAKQQRLFA